MSRPVYPGRKAVDRKVSQKRSDGTQKSLPKREYELHRAQGDQRMELEQGEQETELKGHGDRAKTPSCRCLPL